MYCCYVFFFKQKTAYEMRISDWSSDVCSSDLWLRHRRSGGAHLPRYNVLGLEGEMLARIEAQSFSHPWLLARAVALPGKTVHVAFLPRAQKSLELYPAPSALQHNAAQPTQAANRRAVWQTQYVE